MTRVQVLLADTAATNRKHALLSSRFGQQSAMTTAATFRRRTRKEGRMRVIVEKLDRDLERQNGETNKYITHKRFDRVGPDGEVG